MSSTYNPIQYTLGDAYSATEILVRLERTSLPAAADDFTAVPECFQALVHCLPGLASICPLFLDARDILRGAPTSPFTNQLTDGLKEYLGNSLTLIRWVKGSALASINDALLSATQVLNLLTNYRLRFDTPAQAAAALKQLKAEPTVAVAERAPYRYITVCEPRGEVEAASASVVAVRPGTTSESLSSRLVGFFPEPEMATPFSTQALGGPQTLSTAGDAIQLLKDIRDALRKAGDSIDKCDCCQPKSDVPDASYQNWPLTALETKFDPNRGTGVRVAMLDLGVDWSHPNLKTRVHIGIANTDAGPNSIVTPMESVAQTFSSSLLDPHKPIGHHGTAVAGVMIGGKAGLLPKGEVISYQVCSGEVIEYADAQGKKVKRFTVDSVLYASALWAVGAHCTDIDAVNISLGGSAPLCQFEQIGYHQIRASGIMPVAGSGNHFRMGDDPSVNYPARHPEVISVGAVGIEMSTQFYKLAHFSNFDPDAFLVNLMAPGVGIYSCMPERYNLKDDHGWFNGTSLATPWVTALYALARKENKAFILNKLSQKLHYQKADVPFDSEHGYGLAKFSKIFEDAADASTEQALRRAAGQLA